MTDSDLPKTFDPGAGGDLAAWPLTSDATVAPGCPWCSAGLPDPDVGTCPSCLATLVPAEEVEVPGVTTIDPVMALRTRTRARSRPRRDLLGWITGEAELTTTYDDPIVAIPPAILSPGMGQAGEFPAGSVAPPLVTAARPSADALAPPDARIRREMLRMELAAVGLELPEEELPGDVDRDGARAGSDARDPSDPPGA